MSFLPTGEREPSTSNYMRFEEGENTFRVLSSAITGWEYWKTVTGDDGKPVRKPFRVTSDVTVDINELEEDPKTGKLQMPRYFWAFVVYNRRDERVQILEITQKKIQRSMRALVANEDWGDPKEYDITVTREGEGFDTEYNVMPKPKKKADSGLLQMATDMNINLSALYKGEDPFEGKKDQEIDPEEIPEFNEE